MQREILHKHLIKELKGLTLEEFAALFITKTTALEQFYRLQHGVKDGNMISLLFNPHRLDTETITSPISVYQSLQYDNLLSGLARLYIYNLEKGINNSFFHALQRGYNGIQYVNEFPPFVARSIIENYTNYKKNGNTINVLDPCGGWGGRLIGAASLGNVSYTCCEPASKTFNGLNKLGDWCKSLAPEFEYDVCCLPFEEFSSLKKFDLALTSPPYYDTEHYSDENTNSMNRYKSFEDWIEGFFKVLILNTMCMLKDDAVFILNIGTRKYPLDEAMVDVCENNDLYCDEVHKNYLSGNGEGRERFYKISKTPIIKRVGLF